jgi:hypothetical protein
VDEPTHENCTGLAPNKCETWPNTLTENLDWSPKVGPQFEPTLYDLRSGALRELRTALERGIADHASFDADLTGNVQSWPLKGPKPTPKPETKTEKWFITMVVHRVAPDFGPALRLP